MSVEIEADYFVIGGGAMGMAFADEILRGSKSARVVVVDRRTKPGGHWNDAYRFVTLHQPALYYGVNSEQLGSGGRDLVSQAQILAYYERVQKKLEATGRFTFLPLSEAHEDGRVVSVAAQGSVIRVRARKTVDAAYMDVRVPATTPPAYSVGEKTSLVPVGGLAHLARPHARYVVVGAGKTGIDAALFLLDRGVAPDTITWIMPNDAWLLNRDSIQPDQIANEALGQIRAFHASSNLSEVFDRIEAEGRLFRIDPAVQPARYRCATVTQDELDELRRIEDVVRQGRVSRIEGSRVELRDGVRIFDEDSADILYVDCTADGLARRPAVPIFTPDRITLQSISMCQQVMSAAAIAALELRYESDEEKNAFVSPVPHPVEPPDFARSTVTTLENTLGLFRALGLWGLRSRLSAEHHMRLFDHVRFAYATWRTPLPDMERAETLIAAG